MIPDRLRALHGEALTPKQSQTTQDYSIYLSRPNGLLSLDIHGCIYSSVPSKNLRRGEYLGNPTADGRYEIPISFHGICCLDGDMLATAMQKAAEQDSALQVSLSGRTLRFSCTKLIPLPLNGHFRGGANTIYTLMFRMRAPDFSGSKLNSGFSINYSGTYPAISQSGSFTGEEAVDFLVNTLPKRVDGLCVSSTDGSARELDLDSFGIYIGTLLSPEEREPYREERMTFSLAAPLRTVDTFKDVAYPMKGYATRWVCARAFEPKSPIAVDIGSPYPTYRVELPEDLHGKDLSTTLFTMTKNKDLLLQYSMYVTPTEDKKGLLFSASATENTPEKFLSLFEGKNAELLWLSDVPMTEHFPPVPRPTLPAGQLHITFETLIRPFLVKFTYL